MLKRCPIVSERTYHALRLGTCVFCTQSYESTFILKMKNTFKWNVHLLGVVYRACKWWLYNLRRTTNTYTETKDWRTISSHDFYAHDAEFETPMRSHRMWISHTVDFHICNILHVTIFLKELIAHNTSTKWLRIIPSLGSSQIQSLNSAACLPQHIWHTADLHTRNTFCVTTSEELILHTDTK